MDIRRRNVARSLMLAALLCAAPALAAEAAKTSDNNTYDQDSVIKDATAWFGKGSEGLAKVVEKAFKEHGRPNGYIKGEEAGGAITVGLRYGHGTLHMKAGSTRSVHWQGPSIGFDLGANASKVFVLVYNLQNTEQLFQRFPAIDGSFYYVGGAGINYQRRDNITLAPIRLGVGLRAGASIGYVHYTKTKTLNPF
ncbi:MAG: DUF1134 domain-containing protein [Betaproteobacteria bacterium]